MVINPVGVGWTILQGMSLSRENVTYFVREIVGTGVALDADKEPAFCESQRSIRNPPPD
jgi:hypothetical protein